MSLVSVGVGGHLESSDYALEDGAADDLTEVVVRVTTFRLGTLHYFVDGRHEFGCELL